MRTYLADNLIVLQNTPRDVDTVIIPVCPRHVLVDVGVDASHAGRKGWPVEAFADGQVEAKQDKS